MNLETVWLKEGIVNFIYTIEVVDNTSILCLYDESDHQPFYLPLETHVKEALTHLSKLLRELPEHVAMKASSENWYSINSSGQLTLLHAPVNDYQFPQWFVANRSNIIDIAIHHQQTAAKSTSYSGTNFRG